MVPFDHAETADRLARIELMIEKYRLATQHRLKRRALTLWRKIEARQMVAKLEKPIEPVH
jgi:hypothetical protein